MKKTSLLFGLYVLVIFCLFLYSYTQVDLSLTLSRASIYQSIEKSFQYIGYFQRPVSAILYKLLLFLLFVFYTVFLILANKSVISKKQVWTVIIASTVVLTLSYNAFSYDLFNYIFDAKIVTHYHQNPYMYKALDFPGDPMLSFMRWTHRTYPYGPLWLAVTIPLSLIGFQFFLPTFLLFKLLMSVCFLGSVYLIGKIFQKINPKEELFGIVLFALNPLVLIESLVSSHNDIVMMFFALAAIYFLISKKYVRAFILLFLSIGIKYATIFLLPVFIFVFLSQRKNKKIDWKKVFLVSAVCMIFPMIFAVVRTNIQQFFTMQLWSNFQPWYFLFTIPLAVLVGKKYYTVIPVFLLSVFFLLEYAAYIYYGDYNPPVPSIMFRLTIGGVGASIAGVFLYVISSLLPKKS